MGKISVQKFISELDLCFSKEDLQGAGDCLLRWRSLAADASDSKGELTVLNEMIGYYRQTRQETEGLEAINDAFALIDSLGIGNTPSAATIYLNGATTMKSFGKSEEAMEFYEKTLNVYRVSLSENNPLFAGLYNNMALALQDLKKYDESEKYFMMAIEITEKDKKNALETAVSCINLAHLYYETDNEDVRINSLMEKALDILECPDFFGYEKYAFTCRKCAPSFGFFGYFLAEKRLDERADRIYAGS